jgi:outer membrane protein OmpA-like peptidoglycan-associated protein
MSRYDTYTPAHNVAPAERGWVISALVGSAVLHAGLFTFFYFKQVESFGQRELPPTKKENIQRVTVSLAPKKKEEVTTAVITDAPKTTKKEIVLPKEKIALEEISIAPQHKSVDTSKLFANEKPSMEVAKLNTTIKSGNPDDLLPKLDDRFFADRTGPKVMARPASSPGPDGDGTAQAIGVAGKDVGAILDALNDAPASSPKALSLPGNTTFDYDSDQLGLQGREAMEKVAEVFKKFLGDDLMSSTFSITGHTDSFGTAEYNEQLSLRRAEVVRAWLVANLGIDPQNVRTAGEGSRKMLVPEGTVEEQAPNRRVEIVIRRRKQ